MSKFAALLSNVLSGGFMQSVSQIVDETITNKEEAAKIKLAIEAENHRHKEAMLLAVSQNEKAYLDDVADARHREVELRNSIGVWVQNIAASTVISAFVCMVFVVIYKKTAVENIELVYTVIGSLGTVVVQIFQYWFGSSRGSESKEQKLWSRS